MSEAHLPSGEIISTTDGNEKARFSITGPNTAVAQLSPEPAALFWSRSWPGGVGLIAGCIAFLLYKLIGLITNIVFYGHLSAAFVGARHHHLGWWVIAIPVIGGLIVGIMGKYGSPRWKPCWRATRRA